MVRPTKRKKSLLLHYQPSFPGKKTKNPPKKTPKKQKLKQEKMDLPTKESESLLLHYQPSFPGKKIKKSINTL